MIHKDQRGNTYLEVVICMVVLTLVIGSMSSAFSLVFKTHQMSLEEEKVSLYGEALLELVKEQLNVQELNIKEPLKLEEFLSLSAEALQQNYETTRYSYGIALWQLEGQPIAYLCEAMQIVSSENAFQDLEAFPLNFSEGNQVETSQNSIQLLPGDDSNYRVIMTLEEGVALNAVKGEALVYELKTQKQTPILIQVDGSALITQEGKAYETLKIINQSQCECLIQINQPDFPLKVENKGRGQTILQQTTYRPQAQSFIIALVIRDQKPLLGQAGKIVKKQVTLYTGGRNEL